MRIRRSSVQVILLVLSLVSVAISIYLTVVHYQGGQVACTTGGIINCERVLSSLYSVVPGTQLPVSLAGLFWFAVAAVISVVGLRRPQLRLPRVSMFVWTLLGMLTVLYLVYVEIVRLDAICLWCTSLHIIIFIMFLISVTRLQAGSSDADEYDEVVPEKEVVNR